MTWWLRFLEGDADVSKHVAVLTVYIILLMYICCAFVGLDNKQFKMNEMGKACSTHGQGRCI